MGEGGWGGGGETKRTRGVTAASLSALERAWNSKNVQKC